MQFYYFFVVNFVNLVNIKVDRLTCFSVQLFLMSSLLITKFLSIYICDFYLNFFYICISFICIFSCRFFVIFICILWQFMEVL